MRKLALILALGILSAACGGMGLGDEVTTTTSVVDPTGDQPIAEPGEPGEIPEPRPPIEGSIDGAVFISSADLRLMESFPIQVALDVAGDKPTPCHEVFWTVEDTGEAIEITMISQINADQNCAQVLEPFMVAVPLGSWQDESRDVVLNGEVVGSFDS